MRDGKSRENRGSLYILYLNNSETSKTETTKINMSEKDVHQVHLFFGTKLCNKKGRLLVVRSRFSQNF